MTFEQQQFAELCEAANASLMKTVCFFYKNPSLAGILSPMQLAMFAAATADASASLEGMAGMMRGWSGERIREQATANAKEFLR